jgi:hypothetical protein
LVFSCFSQLLWMVKQMAFHMCMPIFDVIYLQSF